MSENNFTQVTENEFIKKIVAQQSDLFFQFTVFPDATIAVDYASQSVSDFYELSAQEIKDNPKIIFEERVFVEDLKRFNNTINYAAKNLSRWELDYRVILPQKGLKWINVSAKTQKLDNGNVLFYGTKTDISQIKKEQENHKISEARNQFANMASNVGVWDWDLITNKVYYSPESLKILEISDDNQEIIDNPENWDDRVHPDDLSTYFGNIKLHFDQKIPYYETYHRILCNGKYKWILDRGKVIVRDTKGNPLRIIGTHTDVSSQKDKEQNLADTLELVNEQKNKLLNFAHIVSHNLKNHTGNLSSLLEMKETGMLEEVEVFEHLKSVSHELTTTLDNLIELVEVQSNQNEDKKELNLNEYLDKTFSILLDEKNKFTNNVPANFTINFIPAYLESILLNLTSNAIRYSSPKRKLNIQYNVDFVGDYKVLSVTDNGLGIDLDRHQESIFGLYKTFHAHEESRGIGLYITKNQIEAMGGKIELESQVDVGTTFKIYFK